jgi:hypothetical protein
MLYSICFQLIDYFSCANSNFNFDYLYSKIYLQKRYAVVSFFCLIHCLHDVVLHEVLSYKRCNSVWFRVQTFRFGMGGLASTSFKKNGSVVPHPLVHSGYLGYFLLCSLCYNPFHVLFKPAFISAWASQSHFSGLWRS